MVNGVIDVSGINFFMPIFSFLFVFIVIYAILFKTKVLGDNKFVNSLVSFIISIIFLSFSSMETYVRNIIPWFAVLVVILFLVLMVMMFSTKKYEDMMTKGFAWFVVAIFIIVFLIVAINVFNPVFHQDRILVSGDNPQVISQLIYFIFYSNWAGTILLLIIAAVVAWVITKK
jgi:hypothetical protein